MTTLLTKILGTDHALVPLPGSGDENEKASQYKVFAKRTCDPRSTSQIILDTFNTGQRRIHLQADRLHRTLAAETMDDSTILLTVQSDLGRNRGLLTDVEETLRAVNDGPLRKLLTAMEQKVKEEEAYEADLKKVRKLSNMYI